MSVVWVFNESQLELALEAHFAQQAGLWPDAVGARNLVRAFLHGDQARMHGLLMNVQPIDNAGER